MTIYLVKTDWKTDWKITSNSPVKQCFGTFRENEDVTFAVSFPPVMDRWENICVN